MVPLIFNPIISADPSLSRGSAPRSTPSIVDNYLLGISPFKGLLGVVKQLGYRPKGTTIFPMTTKIRSFTTRPVLRDQHFPPGHRLVQTKQSFIVFRCDVPEQQIKDLAGRFLWVHSGEESGRFLWVFGQDSSRFRWVHFGGLILIP